MRLIKRIFGGQGGASGPTTAGNSPSGRSVSRLQERLQATHGIHQHEVYAGPKGGETQAIGIAFGDMTTVAADAYVVPHFNGAASYGGVGAAMVRAGARTGMQAYEAHLATLCRPQQSRAVQGWGDVYVTPSGGGLAPHLIHAVTVGSPDLNTEAEAVSGAVWNACAMSRFRGFESIVLPALGTGIIGKLADATAAVCILAALETFLVQRDDRLAGATQIAVVIYGNPAQYAAFNEIMREGPRSATAKAKAARAGKQTVDMHRWARGMDLMVATMATLDQTGPDQDPTRQ